MICASLWPDPADELCPEAFRKTARAEMTKWARQNLGLLGQESFPRFNRLAKNGKKLDDNVEIRKALFDFIADFANWDNSTVKEYLETARALTQTAHEALGGASGSRPLIVDPFAGGGSIPLEALRVGADAFASDLNPIAVLLNKVVLEYIPMYGQHLADEVRKWGEWIKEAAEKELAEFYPKDPDGATPIAYLWARTINCEGPGCGAEVPILPSRLLEKSRDRSIWINLSGKGGSVHITIHQGSVAEQNLNGTAKRGSVTCPCCGYTTPIARVREQLKKSGGGVKTARLLAVAVVHSKNGVRDYRLPHESDYQALAKAAKEIIRLRYTNPDFFPDETLPLMSGVFNVPLYGHNTWSSLYSDRQLLLLITLCRLVKKVGEKVDSKKDVGFASATVTMLSLAIGKVADYSTSICTWVQSGAFIGHTFAQGQCLPMKFDFAEGVPLVGYSGSWEGAIDWGCRIIEREADALLHVGQSELVSATAQSLPDDTASCLITDPPYYNAVPYADLSDFFYVWHRRTLGSLHSDLFQLKEAPKAEEICEMSGWDPDRYGNKTAAFFENEIGKAFADSRRVLSPTGIGVVVFAHKTTSGWEAMLQALVSAGWTITASWPIDTEMAARLRARNSAVLASSIHLVCRPRENADCTVSKTDIGDWRDVLAELPNRIHDWMPRLADEGVVGADAIFACIGPALEVFSRYSRVEKASGEAVTLKEYLEHVWAAVSKEALKMIFEGADAFGFEEDARLTAMWLWTVATTEKEESLTAEGAEEEDEKIKKKTTGGFSLEYDAARKIAQGLGAHLEDLGHLVEIQGETAVLLPVAARTRYLFGKDSTEAPRGRPKKKDKQLTLGFEGELKQIEEESGDWTGEFKGKAGKTVLDQVHQSMILFAAGRSEALKRFLVEDGIGRNFLFWRLAQSLSALYPTSTNEKRWVDGVLARKKGLGF